MGNMANGGNKMYCKVSQHRALDRRDLQKRTLKKINTKLTPPLTVTSARLKQRLKAFTDEFSE
jgi:hypothetical protein